MFARVLLGLLAFSAAAAGAELFNDKVGVLEEFPREVGRGKTIVLKGALKGAYKTPELILIAPRGKTYKNYEGTINGQAFSFIVRFEEGTGPYRLELIARTPEATRSAARFTIWHGVPRPEVEAEEPEPTGPRIPYVLHVRLLEKRFFRLLNDFRKGIECDPVGWNEAVAARAREHAEHMAEAHRRQHRFGGSGVLEMLKTDGAGPGGLSGSDKPWGNTDSFRPFPPPAPAPPGPRVINRVVVQIVCGDSVEELFERHFVREAAFRICAADPHGLEAAIGAARIATAPPVPGKAPPAGSSTVFFCVCFVQVNEKPVMRQQDDAYSDLLKRAREREPDVLRALGMWDRPKAHDLLEKALDDPRHETVCAALDGLLLLDEAATRARLAERTAAQRKAMEEGRYADAAALFEPFRHVLYDKEIAFLHDNALRDARAAAAREIGALRKKPPEERAGAAEDLRRRATGIGLDAEIDKALARS